MPGDRCNRLTVLQYVGSSKGQRMYRFACDCGNEVISSGTSVKKGHRRSCGCQRSEKVAEHARTSRMQFRHGLSRHPNYTLWQGMRRRCEDPGNKSYGRYGGRGIKVCERWLGRDGFPNFLADMGPQPGPRWHLHRKDGDGDYEPGNCVWMSPADHNALHRALRQPGKLTAAIVRECRERYRRGGITQGLLAAEFGVSYSAMNHAVNGHTWKHVANG